MLDINESKVRNAEYKRTVDAYLLERAALTAKGTKSGAGLLVHAPSRRCVGLFDH